MEKVKIIPRKPFTWLLIAFAVYAYFQYPSGNVEREKPTPISETTVTVAPDKKEPGVTDKPVNELVKKFSETETGQAVMRVLAEQSYKKQYGDKDLSVVTAQNSGKIMTLDTLKGEGEAAICGSTVTFSYTSYTENKIKLDSTDKPVTVKIGGGQVVKGLENGIVGMRKGGTRKIAVPSRLAYDDPEFKSDVAKGSPILFEVGLADVKNGFTTTDVMEVVNITPGEGVNEVLCGNKVNLSYKLFDQEKESSSGKLSFTMGDGTVPVGIEKGIMEMKKGEVRKLYIPKEFHKFMGESALPQDFKIPEGKLVMEVVLE
ncbi:MAG: Peptidylprolyl isomerase [Rickettsiaceae bacterium]|nr:Peptidylprolyl isomerase [Rickettsiaceae bacterium]